MKLKLISIVIVALLLGFGFGFAVNKFTYGNRCDIVSLKYVNPQIACGTELVVNKRNYVEFKNVLNKIIQEKIDNKEILEISIYFRDLQYGPTFGINEYAKYAPASLLKLPLALTYVDLLEKMPELNKIKLYYQPERYASNLVQTYAPSKSIEDNSPYTIDQLLLYMIEYSDNKSYFLLADYLLDLSPDSGLLKNTYIDLGIIDPQSELDDTITVKSYASIFTQLYHSSYLKDKESSEKVLDLLLRSDFEEGIKKGIPAGMDVAHKFGERYGFDGDLKQLHDCGIVYYPENPYLICIMTQGYDNDKLSEIIGLISKMVYEEFDSRKF